MICSYDYVLLYRLGQRVCRDTNASRAEMRGSIAMMWRVLRADDSNPGCYSNKRKRNRVVCWGAFVSLTASHMVYAQPNFPDGVSILLWASQFVGFVLTLLVIGAIGLAWHRRWASWVLLGVGAYNAVVPVWILLEVVIIPMFYDCSPKIEGLLRSSMEEAVPQILIGVAMVASSLVQLWRLR